MRREEVPPSPHAFNSERRTPMTVDGFPKLLERIGQAADRPFPVHRSMLRYACAFKLANEGHDTRALRQWLEHRNVQDTTRYTELTTQRFRDF